MIDISSLFSWFNLHAFTLVASFNAILHCGIDALFKPSKYYKFNELYY